MYRILIIEDDQRVAGLLKNGLEESGFEATAAYDGEMGLRLARQGNHDLIVSDVVLPGINGFELCREIKTMHPSTPIIMLTALGTTDDKLDGFDAGADDYMVKPFDFRELVARINVLLRRKSSQQPAKTDVITYADMRIDTRTQKVYRGEILVRLSPKEYKLLLYMIQHADRVLTRAEISENVWDTHFDTGTNFIDVYINYLRKKVDKDFATKLIHTRTGMGFIFTDKP